MTFKLRKKCVTNNSNVLVIIKKKSITWALNHCFKGPNYSFFFYFVLLI